MVFTDKALYFMTTNKKGLAKAGVAEPTLASVHCSTSLSSRTAMTKNCSSKGSASRRSSP
jgi:hypothetical protein